MSGLLLSFVFTVLMIVTARFTWRSRAAAIFCGVCFFVFMFLNVFFIVADQFTGSGIDEAVLYHLLIGLRGAGFGEYTKLIAFSAVYLLLSVIFSYVVYRFVLGGAASRSFGSVLVLVLAGAALIVNPTTHDMVTLSKTWSSPNTANNDDGEYEADLVVLSNKKNIVYIYLESVERTYLDNTLFPGLTPNLHALEKHAISYTDVRQVPGTGWTIAGMVASQCGIPLVTPSHGNSVGGYDQFLPGAMCFGDVLRENGYDLFYMGGASVNFAGKGNFYRSHGFEHVNGREVLQEKLVDPSYQTGWGLYDDSLFSQLKEKYMELSSRERPFALFSLTLDTHHPNGHCSAPCLPTPYGDGSNPILNAVHCTDKLVKDFVDFIRISPYANNTIIVIASDHLAMRNTASDILRQGDRRNLLMIFPPPEMVVSGRQYTDRPASTLDIAPTLLSLLSKENQRLGFGRSLLNKTPTLTQSKEDINRYLEEQRGFLNTLWHYPQMDSGITIADDGSRLVLGERSIAQPAIFKLSHDGRVEQIIVMTSDSPEKSAEDYMLEMTPDDFFLWADDCIKLNNIFSEARVGNDINGMACMVAGSLAGNVGGWSLTPETNISLSDVLLFAPSSSLEDDTIDTIRRERINRMKSQTEKE